MEIFRDGLERLRKEEEEVAGLVEVDMFATGRNSRLERYVTPVADPKAEGSDAFSLVWKGVKIYAHPPIAIIAKVLRKIEEEKVEAIVVIPNWPTQPWWPVLQKLVWKSVILGNSEEVLVPGQAMKGRMTKLPPGQMMMSRISWRK
jgi:hypothetical protein